MASEVLKSLKRNENGIITVVFTLAFEFTINRPSRTSYAAWAVVESGNELIIVKESGSTSSHYAQQDIGYNLHSPSYSQHYDVSNNQYDKLFGKGTWEKQWMEPDEFQKWRNGRELRMSDLADSLQKESWKSTGH